jgi:hypothetical protein
MRLAMDVERRADRRVALVPAEEAIEDLAARIRESFEGGPDGECLVQARQRVFDLLGRRRLALGLARARA